MLPSSPHTTAAKPYGALRGLALHVADDFIGIADAARILGRSPEDLTREIDGGACPLPVRVQTVNATKDIYLRGLDSRALDEYLRFGFVRTDRLRGDADFQNRIRRWLRETCVRDLRGKIASQLLYDQYVETTQHTGKYGSGLTNKDFKSILLAIGVERKRGNRVVEWRGIRLRRDDDFVIDPSQSAAQLAAVEEHGPWRWLGWEAALDWESTLAVPNPSCPRFSWDAPKPVEIRGAKFDALMVKHRGDFAAVCTILDGHPPALLHGKTVGAPAAISAFAGD